MYFVYYIKICVVILYVNFIIYICNTYTHSYRVRGRKQRNIKNSELMPITEFELSISAINVNGLNSLLKIENSKVGNVHLPKDCARMFIEAAFQTETNWKQLKCVSGEF